MNRLLYMLIALVIPLLPASPALGQTKEYDHKSVNFLWIVVNNNRVIAGERAQANLEREICRALECSGAAVSKPNIAFCERHRANSPFIFKAEAWCPATRYRERERSKYWIPLPEIVPTWWDEIKASYQEPRTNLRTIRAWRKSDLGVSPGISCRWKLEGVDPDFVEAPCDIKKVAIEEKTPIEAYERTVALGETYVLYYQEKGSDGDWKDRGSRIISVDDVLIVAIGDSMTSGEGNPHAFRKDQIDDGTASASSLDEWWDRRCHRSMLGYPSLATTIAAIQSTQYADTPKHSFTYLNFACSGATIKRSAVGAADLNSGGLLDPYEGTESQPSLRNLEALTKVSVRSSERAKELISQLDAVERHLCPEGEPCTRQPDYVIFSIGVNDIGFAGLVNELIKWCPWRDWVVGKCARHRIKPRLGELAANLAALADRIERLKVKRHVLVLAYPDLTHNEKFKSCDDFVMENTLGPKYASDADIEMLGKTPMSSLWVGVTRKDAEYAYRRVLKPLNGALSDIVRTMNLKQLAAFGGEWPIGGPPPLWQFVEGGDTFSQLRGWCARPSWFVRWIQAKHKQGMATNDYPAEPAHSNTVTTGTAHPNVYGHNFLNWQIRCTFEKNGLIPEGKTGAGAVRNQVCTWKSKPPPSNTE